MFSKKTQKSAKPISTSVSKSLPIQYKTNIKISTLQQNLCDPFTNSPPNEFMKKLYTRMEHYNGCTSLGVHSNSLNNE
jgi:hypothetical protein